MYTKMLESTEERINSQNDSAQKKIKQLVDEIERASNDNRARQSDMVLRMQNDENDLQTRLGELNKEIKNVASQMSVFEKAENMKQQLEEEIDSLSEGFDKLEGFKVAADAFRGQFDALCDMNDEAEKRLEKFNTARKQIDSLEKDFSKIIAMSGSMDEKIRELQSTSDDLQTMEVKVRNFQETLAGISISYERLDKKAEVIERVSNDVDKSFEMLKSLEQRITACNRQVESLPDEIEDVQKNVDVLLKNTKHLDSVVDKLDSLQEILKDTEERIDRVHNDREGLVRAEERITELSKSVDTRMSALKAVADADSKKSGSARTASRGPSPRKRDNIRTLKQQGWTNEQIAESLKVPLAEVELVLELPE